MSTEMIKVTSLGELAGVDPERMTLWASFPTDSPEGRKLAYNATVSCDFVAADVIGQELEIQNVVVYPASKVNEETGELDRWLMTVLITGDGGRIQVGSGGVIRALARLEATFGPMPWHPPLTVKISQRPCGGGRRFYTLELV